MYAILEVFIAVKGLTYWAIYSKDLKTLLTNSSIEFCPTMTHNSFEDEKTLPATGISIRSYAVNGTIHGSFLY